jgi:thiol-disulfide isomerase/thioredoxin
MAPVAAPALQFTDGKGQKRSLSNYKGHVLLVNLWATWCGPCVEEIPTLAALAGQMQAYGGLVLPISIDANGIQAVRPFYALHAITNLPILLDTDGNNLDVLNTDGVPVSLIIDPAGRLVGRLDGSANWNTPRVRAILQALAPAQHQTKPAHAVAI